MAGPPPFHASTVVVPLACHYMGASSGHLKPRVTTAGRRSRPGR